MNLDEIENLEIAFKHIIDMSKSLKVKDDSFIQTSDIIRKSNNALLFLEFLKDKDAFKMKYGFGEEGIML